MDLVGLKNLLTDKNIYPVHIEDDVDENKSRGFSFCGDFQEYLEAVSTLGHKVLFISTLELDEENFLYNFKMRHEDTGELELEEIDLIEVNPDMEKFKTNIGNVATFKIATSMSSESLNYYIHADWWVDFVEICYDTIQDVQTRKSELIEARKADQQKMEIGLIKSVKNLARDDEFRKLKTQRAMMTYAAENIPEIETLDSKILRREIQILYDKIK